MVSDEVMALIAVTRNLRAHLNQTRTFGKVATAKQACREYHKALRIMLESFPTSQVEKVRQSVFSGPSYELTEEMDFIAITCATSERLLGMSPR